MTQDFGIYFSQSGNWPYFILLIALVALIVRTEAFRKTILIKLGAMTGAKSADQNAYVRPVLRTFKSILFVSGIFFVWLSLMGPQWGQKAQVIKAQGLDICFALDLSGSMLAEDAQPNRLEQAKNQLSIFLQSLGGDRAALVGFAGTGYVASPLSIDHSAITGFLDPMNPSFISNQSTNLASGVDACLVALGLSDLNAREDISDLAAKLIVLISDGEDQIEDYNNAVSRAEKLGIPIYAMAAGTAKGSTIPVRDARGNQVGYIKNESGQPVISKLEEKALKEIVKKTGGKIFYLSTGVDAWKRFADSIINYKRDSKDAGTKLDREERFQWPLIIGTLLLLLEFLSPEAGFSFIRGRTKNQIIALIGIVTGLAQLPLTSAVKAQSSAPEQADISQPEETVSPESKAENPPLFEKNKPRNPNVFLNNNLGLRQSKKKNFGEAQKHFEDSLLMDASDPIVRFNWATNKMFSSLNKEGNPNPKVVEEAVREMEILRNDLTKKSSPSPEDRDLLKALNYQLGHAYELLKSNNKALDAYYRVLQSGRPNAGNLDAMSKKNISRLITKSSSSSGGGGGDSSDSKEGESEGGDGNEGNDKDSKKPEKPKEDGADHTDKKQKPKFSGADVGEEEARQILESVSGEEREVQKRKAQGEAKDRAGKDANATSNGNSNAKPW